MAVRKLARHPLDKRRPAKKDLVEYNYDFIKSYFDKYEKLYRIYGS